jgi:hypothetical protein
MAMHVALAARRNRLERQERDLCDAFRLADATAPDRAQTLSRLGLEHSGAFARLESAGSIRRAAGGYYLDEAALIGQRASAPRRRVLLIVLAVVLANTIVGLILLLVARS